MDNAAQNGRQAKAPPYVSYKTFRTFLEDMHNHGLPGRIDYSVLGRFSGTVRTQLMTALRVLDLIDPDDHPTELLRELKSAFGTDDWQSTLRRVLEKPYGPVFAINLEHATPSQLTEAFRAYPTGSEEVRRKCVVFFLSAAQDAGVPVSKRILDSNRRGAGSAPKRRPREQKSTSGTDAGRTEPGKQDKEPPRSEEHSAQQKPPAPNQNANPNRHAYDALSAIWAPGEMPEDVDAAVVTVLRYLRKKETESKN